MLRAIVARHTCGIPRVFWILTGGQVINRMGEMVLPFLVFFLSSRGLTVESTGAVIAAVGAGGVVGSLVGGILTDRVGPRYTMVGGLLATAASYALLVLARGLPALVAVAFLVGLAANTYQSAHAAFIAVLVPPEGHALAYGLNHWAINIGIAASGACAGFLIGSGYWLLCAVDAATCVLFAALIAARVPNAVGGPANHPDRRHGYAVTLRDRLLLIVLLMAFVDATVDMQIRLGIPQAVRDDGLAPSTFGLALATNCVMIVLLQPLSRAWLARFPDLLVLAGSLLTFGAGLALTGLASTTWQYLLTVAIWTCGEIGSSGLVPALVAGLAAPVAHGRYQAMLRWAWAAARLIGPLAGSGLYGAFGPPTLWWACFLLEAAAAAICVLLRSAVERRRSADFPLMAT